MTTKTLLALGAATTKTTRKTISDIKVKQLVKVERHRTHPQETDLRHQRPPEVGLTLAAKAVAEMVCILDGSSASEYWSNCTVVDELVETIAAASFVEIPFRY